VDKWRKKTEETGGSRFTWKMTHKMEEEDIQWNMHACAAYV